MVCLSRTLRKSQSHKCQWCVCHRLEENDVSQYPAWQSHSWASFTSWGVFLFPTVVQNQQSQGTTKIAHLKKLLSLTLALVCCVFFFFFKEKFTLCSWKHRHYSNFFFFKVIHIPGIYVFFFFLPSWNYDLYYILHCLEQPYCSYFFVMLFIVCWFSVIVHSALDMCCIICVSLALSENVHVHIDIEGASYNKWKYCHY